MANKAVRIIERVQRKDGTWTNIPVDSPRLQTKYNVPTLYLKDKRRGKFRLVWHEGSQKKYSADYIPTLEEAIRQKKLKQLYLANIAAGLKAEDPLTQGTRFTIANAIDMFLNELTGRGNTVDLYTHNLNQFRKWTTKTYIDQIDRVHILGFKKFLETSVGNEEYTAVWKCIRVNKMIKTVLRLGPGQGPVKKSDFSDVLNRKPLVTTYHKDERDKYLAACKGTELIIWTLFLKCGLRLGEVSHLEWSDIDFVRHVIRARKKEVQDGLNIVQFIPKKWSIRDIAGTRSGTQEGRQGARLGCIHQLDRPPSRSSESSSSGILTHGRHLRLVP